MKRSVKTPQGEFEYELVRTRLQNVSYKALPESETRVYAPVWMCLRTIDDLVRQHSGELRRMHEQFDKALERNRLSHPLAENSRMCIEGRGYELRRVAGARVTLKLNGDVCELTLPDMDDEDKVRDALKRALSRRALKRIRERLVVYAPQLGVCYGRVAIRDQRTRWGSCSSKQNLNFNWKLIMAPPDVLNYVVIHELCHLIEFNHSPRFWKLVENQMPEYDCWKKWLKVHGGELGVD